ncbi:MAG: PAS domain-containing protein [Rhodospirillales bacterium]|nr:PAS domain-containing protein [Rhodospirillales bacterium]
MDTLTTTVIVALAAAVLGVVGGIVAVKQAFALRAADRDPLEQQRKILAEAQKLARAGLCRFEIASGRAVWSEEMYRIAGFDPGAKTLGFWAFPDMVHPEDREDVRRRLHEAAAGTAAFETEFRIVRPDGTTRAVHGIARREVDDNGNVVYVHGAFIDITEHKEQPEVSARGVAEPEASTRRVAEAEAALDDARKALAEAEAARASAESASRAKSGSLAVLSHELRTPLNSILGFAGIIESETFGPAGSERYIDYARDIRKSGEHILGVINNILDLSKIESGRMELNEELVNLLVVMSDAANLFLEQASDQGVTMKTALPRSLPVLKADPRLIRQMLINLISNALRYTRRGGWIELTADRNEQGGITLAVADTGVGIAPEDVSRILKPHQTFGKPIGTSARGTGLGLPLVKSLIELHGGTFRLESTPGSGTVVSLWFPRARVGANPGSGGRRKPGISVVGGAPKAIAGSGS